jgi:hypothetical protein
MEKKYSDRELAELVDKATKRGAVLAILHFDAHGKEPEAPKTTLVEFISNLSREKGFLYCKGEIDAPVETGGMYSSCAEVRVLAASFGDLVNAALKYGPIGVVLEKPAKIVLGLDEAQNLLVDVSDVAQDYAKFIYEKTLKGEDLLEFQKKLSARAELGKKLLEKK